MLAPPDDKAHPLPTSTTIAATAVELDDGRLALLVEMEPDPGLGPLVVGPLGNASATASQDSPEEPS